MPFNLEKEALLASGVRNHEEFSAYLENLHYLYEQFTSQITFSHEPLIGAKQLFDWLWETKPSRYQIHSSYKLTDVIDNQIDKKTEVVGNCLGLTLLYNCLLRKTGLKPKAVYLENAFGIGPHVLSCLDIGQSTIDIENIFSKGFDYRGHINAPMRIVWENRELIGDIYHSQGNESFEKGDFSNALYNYKMAINLNPKYNKAHFNIAILLDRMKGEKGPGSASVSSQAASVRYR